MDIRMPETDGLAATEEIRKIKNCAHIPVIAISASVDRESKAECLRAGMTDFIEKPFFIEQIRRILKKYLPAEKRAVRNMARDAASPKPEESAEKTVLPCAEERKELVRMARIGDVKALKNLLQETDLKSEKYQIFTRICRKLLKTYDEEKNE